MVAQGRRDRRRDHSFEKFSSKKRTETSMGIVLDTKPRRAFTLFKDGFFK